MKNYLPSKKFSYSIIVVIILGILIFGVSSYFSKKNKYNAEKEAKLQAGKSTINQLLQKDTDIDGVMDWEEALWGTDKNKMATFDDIPDATYIKNKRAELKIADGDLSEGGKTLNETDKFSQEFFASILAMKESGQIDQNTIKNVSSALGQKIADPTITDEYSEKDIKINKNNDTNTQRGYYLKAKSIFNKYQKLGIGDELTSVQEIAGSDKTNTDPNSIEELNKISNLYKDLAKEMTKIYVPNSLSSYHIRIINDSNNTGISILNLININSDPIIGLSGISQYKKYSEDLVSSVSELETFLLKN